MSKQPSPLVTLSQVKREFYPSWGFRENMQMYHFTMNFVFLNGGFGDYINWLTPIEWIASEATWISGALIVPVYFKPVAEYFLRKYPNWRGVKTYKELQDIPKADDTPFRGPVILQQESLNATGAHLSTCGWVYFTNKEKAPPGWDRYPRFEQADLDVVPLPEAAKPLSPGKYVVFTTGVTTPSREIPGGYWNPVLEHVVKRGFIPVFLGKSVVETGNAKNIKTKFSDAIRYDLGVDLRDQTSLMEAASIMSRAAAVVGHDNGLLHFAACTEVPIVFGYNLASPDHREPKRPHLKNNGVFNVHLTKKDLACNFCQSETNFLIGFNFQKCFYSDNKCIDLLFAGEGVKWITAIDQALKAGVESSAL